MAQLIKNLPAMQEMSCNVGDLSSIPGLGRSPREGNDNSFQYPGLGKEPGGLQAMGLQRVRHDLAISHH